LSQCIRCLLDLSLHSPIDPELCPNCGQQLERQQRAEQSRTPNLAPLGPGAPLILFGRFWATVRDVVFRPSRFYAAQAEEIVSPGGLSAALAFAVIIQWLAAFSNFVWSSTLGVVFQRRIDDVFRIAGDVMRDQHLSENLELLRERAIEFLFGAGAIILTPFTTLLKLAFIGLFVHAAVRFFFKEDPSRRHSYSATLKVLSYASAPWVLCVIPGIGALLGWTLTFGASVIGLRVVYRSSTFRALLAVLFPELLLLTIILAGVVALLFLTFHVLQTVF